MTSVLSLTLKHFLPTVFLLGACAAATPVAAQADAAGPAAAAASVVDESALRYFARQGDERRLQAEIARLSAIYPGWVPPADPLSSAIVVDPLIQNLWDLYGAGDIAGAQALITERQATEPTWAPPSDLADALENAQAAAQIRHTISSSDNTGTITLAASHPELLTCQNIDLLWGVGAAFAATDRATRALDAYRYMLTNCDNDRLATIQKADGLFDKDTVTTLLALQRQTAGGEDEFAAIELDLARRELGAALNGQVGRVDPESLEKVQAAAKADKAPDDMRLLGYYELSRNRDRQARTWFEQAYATESSPDSAVGLATALLHLNDGAAAEDLLADIYDETPEIEALYLSAASALLEATAPRAIDVDVLQRIIAAVTTTRSALVAQDLGWYAYGLNQTQTASQWFEQALVYDPAFEPAAYGLIVASNQLNNRQRVRQLIESWGAVSPRIRLFGQPGAPTMAPTRAVIAPPPTLLRNIVFQQERGARPQFMLVAELTTTQRKALRQCNEFMPPENLKPAAALTRGWCLLDIERNAEAQAAFRVATLSPSANIRTDAYYGQTLALLRLGLVDDAAVSASAAPQTAERVQTMQVALLSTTATTYYQLGRYHDALHLLDQRRTLAPEENGLLVIRAWSYFQLNRLREAKQIFTAVAATGYQDAQRGLEALEAKGF